MDVLKPYLDIWPYFLTAFIFAALSTPFIGILAKNWKIYSLPTTLRKKISPSEVADHPQAKARLGGLAVAVPFLILGLIAGHDKTPVIGMLLGVAVLIITGVLDDKNDLPGRQQLFGQVLAACIVIITGTAITQITILNHTFDFSWFEKAFKLGTFVYQFVFPAHIFTLIWILLVINAVNWVFGIDALGEAMTFIGAIAIMLLSVKLGATAVTVYPAILAGATLGYIPFNFPPAKIISGSVGNYVAGFLLAVLSMQAGAKVTASLIILGLPLLDMIWVVIWRLRTHTHVSFFKRPGIGGHVHLHHRLMQAGLSDKQTLYLESGIIIASSTAGFYFAGFQDPFLAMLVASSIILMGFALLSSIIARRNLRQIVVSEQKKRHEDSGDGPSEDTPEERYAY